MTGVMLVSSDGCREVCGAGTGRRSKGGEVERENQLSLIALLLAAIRKSMASCRVDRRADDPLPTIQQMEISWPTDVRHVAHVTFDRFHGFLGLPVEFELEVPGRVPSASASVFGVSAESMQCCYDSKGNSVPTILLLMQDKLYSQEGLKAEGIFRINPENSTEEQVRENLNKGIVPDDIDVHCLAGLIKAWFRELPEGVLDCLSPEQVLQCNTEDECVELIKELLPTQSALLNWAIELMADVVEEEEINKMNARNIAMVFAPNMTQMSDPLTALMHAVQVMNLLKTLILKTLREREEVATGGGYSPFSSSAASGRERASDFGSSQPDLEMRENDSDRSVNGESGRHSSARGSDSGGQQDMDMSDAATCKSEANHCCHFDDSEDGEKDIEEGFLKQLVWKEGCGGQGYFSMLRTSSSSSLGSLISVSEDQQGSLTTSNETCSDASAYKPCEEGEMVVCN